MKKYSKIASLLLILALSLGMLAGCGDEEGSDSLYSQGLNSDGYYNVKASDYVKLGDYSKLTVTQSQIKDAEESILHSYPLTNQITDRAATWFDTVNIDYSGSYNGEKFDGGTATGQQVTIGSGQYVGGFEEGIIGHMPGETFTIDVTFPDPYPNNTALSGAVTQFEIKLNYIIDYQYLEEITDDFVSTNFAGYGWNTKDQLLDYIKYSTAFESLAESSEVSEVPEALTDYFVNTYIADQTRTAEQYGMTLEDLLNIYNISEDELRADYREQAEMYAREALILQAIAEDSNVKVSKKELRDFFLEQTGSSYYTEHKKNYGLPYLKQSVIRYKIENMLKERIEIE
jgi:trigger factor